MIKFCENYARQNGFKSIYCHARDTAVNFYLKNKYIAEGEYFEEDTIHNCPKLKRLNFYLFFISNYYRELILIFLKD